MKQQMCKMMVTMAVLTSLGTTLLIDKRQKVMYLMNGEISFVSDYIEYGEF